MRSFWIIKEHNLALIFERWKKHQNSFSKGWANFKKRYELFSPNKSYQGRISSVGRTLDCRAVGCGFDSWGQTITQGPKITEKWRYKWLDLPVAWMTTSNGSPVSIRRCKDSVINWHFHPKYIDTQIKCFFFKTWLNLINYHMALLSKNHHAFKEISPKKLLKVFHSYKCFCWTFKCFTNCFIRSSKK